MRPVRRRTAVVGRRRIVVSRNRETARRIRLAFEHVEVVRALIDGNAPPGHVISLGWTALIEAIVLGDDGRGDG